MHRSRTSAGGRRSTRPSRDCAATGGGSAPSRRSRSTGSRRRVPALSSRTESRRPSGSGPDRRPAGSPSAARRGSSTSAASTSASTPSRCGASRPPSRTPRSRSSARCSHPEHYAPLRALPNVELRPRIDRADVVGLITAADACLIPHVRTPMTEAMSPLKLYEYLAGGRPVVATDLPPMRGVHPQVELLGPDADVAGAVGRALARGPMDEPRAPRVRDRARLGGSLRRHPRARARSVSARAQARTRHGRWSVA